MSNEEVLVTLEIRKTLEQEIVEVGKCLTELYQAMDQVGSLLEDLSRRMSVLEGERIQATEAVSKILLH
jgi:uncharacterized coiled-coil protein SlyX